MNILTKTPKLPLFTKKRDIRQKNGMCICCHLSHDIGN